MYDIYRIIIIIVVVVDRPYLLYTFQQISFPASGLAFNFCRQMLVSVLAVSEPICGI